MRVERSKVLPAVGYYILRQHRVFGCIDEEAFLQLIVQVQAGYLGTNPYHNDLHVTDVLQQCHFILENGLRELAKLSPLEEAALLISAIIHDFKHPGMNNAYLVNSRHDLAIMYNDQAVLENFHLREAFALIWNDYRTNIFKKLSTESTRSMPTHMSSAFPRVSICMTEEARIMRRLITHCVLHTDYAKHFELCNYLQTLITRHDIRKGQNAEKIIDKFSPLSEFESKQQLLAVCMHAADVSNPTRPFNVARDWAFRVTEEFHNQGDLEKAQNLPVSYQCDRTQTNLPASQVGFISNIIRPYFEKLSEIFPKLSILLDNIIACELQWKQAAHPPSLS